MVQAFESLAKTTGADGLKDFIPISKVVFEDSVIVTIIVIIAIVENVHLL